MATWTASPVSFLRLRRSLSEPEREIRVWLFGRQSNPGLPVEGITKLAKKCAICRPRREARAIGPGGGSVRPLQRPRRSPALQIEPRDPILNV